MPWNTQGGGGGGPWGGGQGPWGRGSGGAGGGGTPPDLEELLRKSQERFRQLVPGGFGGGRGVALVVMAALVLWGLTGFYKVDPDEVGVVLRFGRFVGLTQPGLNYHLPSPIETVMTPSVTRINQVELGYRSAAEGRRQVAGRETTEESLMLTGDENIIDINFSVFWKIGDQPNDPEKYLFNIRDPEGTVKLVAESAIREIIGQLPIRAPLFENRQSIGDRTRGRMQELLDAYGAGIKVTQVQLLKADPPHEVIDAFNDVQRAKADQERLRNEAEAYRNDIIPRARGDSERIGQEAQAYREQVVDLAQGEAKRFTSVYLAYKMAPDVTARRLYIDALEDVLKGATKVVIDPAAKGVIPYLPLPELGKAKPAPAVPATQGASR
ncbi:FtsH protease activity modulator HflK [Telmatospirillum sp.]|uniref:FtsH protease activity modulator HflK n=1 Tax=Telmatospirillum sp. TaxID=2079197 RepID=UPI00283DBF5C|nr:FtsH protease activity modulator HflK [Telmatospirillum sp.]MDR3437676.1 FtsH protease activity modulator HflK [Telmatospirillum sp.]